MICGALSLPRTLVPQLGLPGPWPHPLPEHPSLTPIQGLYGRYADESSPPRSSLPLPQFLGISIPCPLETDLSRQTGQRRWETSALPVVHVTAHTQPCTATSFEAVSLKQVLVVPQPCAHPLLRADTHLCCIRLHSCFLPCA